MFCLKSDSDRIIIFLCVVSRSCYNCTIGAGKDVDMCSEGRRFESTMGLTQRVSLLHDGNNSLSLIVDGFSVTEEENT